MKFIFFATAVCLLALSATVQGQEAQNTRTPRVLIPFFSHTNNTRTVAEQYDFSGKVLVPFCTHEGSGLGNTVEELRQSFPGANVLQGLAVNGRMASRVQNDVTGWLRTLRFIR